MQQLTELEKENDELCRSINENIQRLRAQGLTPSVYENQVQSKQTPNAGLDKDSVSVGVMRPLIQIQKQNMEQKDGDDAHDQA